MIKLVQYHKIQCNTIDYHMKICKIPAIPCNATPYHLRPYNEMQYHATQYQKLRYHAIASHTVEYIAIQNDAIQYNSANMILAGQRKTYHEAPKANGIPRIGRQTQGTAVVIGNDELVDTSSLSRVTSSCQKT